MSAPAKDYAAGVHEHFAGIGAAMFSPESELAIIGAALCSADACADAFDRLTVEQFGDPLHGRMFGAMAVLHRDGRACSPALVRDALGLDEGFEKWGGIGRLQDLAETGSLRGLAQHVEAVADRYVRRSIRLLLDDVGDKVVDTAAGDGAQLLGALEHGAGEIAKSTTSDDRWLDASSMILTAVTNARNRSGVIEFPSGLSELDRLLGGLHRGEATLLAARTGMGKTVGGQVFARETARSGRATLFFSLEMGEDPMALRLACDLAHDRRAPFFNGVSSNITLDRANKNELSNQEWDRLNEMGHRVATWPFRYDVRPGLTVEKIEMMARRAFRSFERKGIEPGLVVIDHLGKVRPSKDRRGNKTAEMADVSNGVAEMAKRLGVPVLGLVQLNRAVEGREDKRPQLSDLRQAGELEEDARQVLFLYRPEYYLRDAAFGETHGAKIEREEKLGDARNKLFWIVGKNSHGPLGQILTYCDIGASAVRDWQP